jgi:hypothetical protein
LADESATLTIKYLHMSNKGEFITGIGTGTQMMPNPRGIAKVTAEGTMWISASRLSHLNGSKWKVEGKVNTIKETVEVRGNFDVSDMTIRDHKIYVDTLTNCKYYG